MTSAPIRFYAARPQTYHRVQVLGILGKGSFGQVLKCHDFRTNTLRAVKVIRNKKRFHHQV